MAQFTIRPATIQDIPALLQFEQCVIKAERPLDALLKNDPIFYYDIPFMISAPHIQLLVAVGKEEQLIASGYARIEDARHFMQYTQHAYLGFMYTDPDYRGQGINRQVITALAKWAATQNVHHLALEVYWGNDPAIKAYEKTGFQPYLLQMRRNLL